MTQERISFRSQYKFPLKLFEVANDGLLIKWTERGTAVVVEQAEFEEKVTRYYPGFVQVKSFHNLRRLFRDYGFKFQVLRKRKPYGLKLEYRHPLFKRDQPEQVLQLRKSKRRYCMHPLTSSSATKKVLGKRKYVRTKLLPAQTATTGDEGSSGFVSFCDSLDSPMHMPNELSVGEYTWAAGVKDENGFPPSSGDYYLVEKNSLSYSADVLPTTVLPLTLPGTCQTKTSSATNDQLTESDLSILAQIYAKNELSAAEFWEVVTRKYSHQWRDKSWEGTLSLLNSIVNYQLSPLHHQGVYHELSIDEL